MWSNETSEEKFGKTENVSSLFFSDCKINLIIHAHFCNIQDSSVLLDYSNDNLPTVVRSLPPTHLMREDPLSSDEEDEQNQQQRTMSRVRQRSLRRKRFIFTNQLTSDELVGYNSNTNISYTKECIHVIHCYIHVFCIIFSHDGR